MHVTGDDDTDGQSPVNQSDSSSYYEDESDEEHVHPGTYACNNTIVYCISFIQCGI